MCIHGKIIKCGQRHQQRLKVYQSLVVMLKLLLSGTNEQQVAASVSKPYRTGDTGASQLSL
jgi:hypothetical protein